MLRDGEPIPEIYQDNAFSRTSHWELSTSQLSSPYVNVCGFGAVVPDGYGVWYNISDDHLRWSITSKRYRAKEFKQHVANAAVDLRRMMELAREAGMGGKPKL
jgi:carnitine O-acetyltransferase